MEGIMAWEKFTKVGRSLKPTISIRGLTHIGFNSAATTEFKLKDFGFGVLYYDKDNKRIGIKLGTDKDEEGALKLRVRDKSGASMPARSFIAYYKLEKLKGKRFNAELDKEKMIVANIEE